MSFVRLPVLRHGLLLRDQELLPDRIIAERTGKIRAMMAAKKVESLLVYSDPTCNGRVCYLTNYPCFGLGRRATAVVGTSEGPFLFTAEPSRNLPRVRIMTTCDLEKTRQFLPMGCERARKLAGSGRIGLVGTSNLPSGLIKDTAALQGAETVDLTEDYYRLMASKDEGALGATRRALALAEEGIGLIAREIASGKDLWETAALVDHHLRLAGCEDMNILLACAAGGRLRPAYPAPVTPGPGDGVIAYMAVQYARHWGVAGTTLKIGPAGDKLAGKLSLIRAAQEKAAAGIKAGTSLGGAKAVLRDAGRQSGLAFAEDVPLAAGVGFDLSEYPVNDADRLEKNMVLQVALAADAEGDCTAMRVGMLQVGESGSAWLAGTK